MAIDTDKVDISTTNATLNIQMNVESIVTRMKSNKRRRNKINEENPDSEFKTPVRNIHFTCTHIILLLISKVIYMT